MSRAREKQERFTKSTLPQRTCAACKKPFAWRKSWERDWERVKYCSERCKRAGTA